MSWGYSIKPLGHIGQSALHLLVHSTLAAIRYELISRYREAIDVKLAKRDFVPLARKRDNQRLGGFAACRTRFRRSCPLGTKAA